MDTWNYLALRFDRTDLCPRHNWRAYRWEEARALAEAVYAASWQREV